MTKKSKPESWKMVEHSWSDTSIYTVDDKYICTLSIKNEATEANQEKLEALMKRRALLMVAAPKMLDMLKSCAEDLAFSNENCDKELHQQLLSTIAKAEDN